MSLRKMISRFVERKVDDTIRRMVEEKTMEAMFRVLSDKPDQELTAVGFRWAWLFAITKPWPDLPRETALRWLDEYLEVPIGTPGHIWTARSAADLAREYVDQFGEVA